MYETYLTILGLAIVSNTALIFVLYRYSQRTYSTISFAVFLFLINMWLIPKFLTNALPAQGTLFEELSRIAAIGYIFMPAAFLVFSLAYGMYYKIFQKAWFWLLLLIPAMTLLYLSWTSNLIGVHDFEAATRYPWGYETPTGKYFPALLAWFDMLMVISTVILIKTYKRIYDPIKKRQALFVILSVVIPSLIGTITNGILPLVDIFVFPVGLLLGNMTAIIVVFAIFKYGLFEVTPLTVLSSINHAIIAVDRKGTILHMNPFTEKMLGVRSSQVIGKSLEQIVTIQYKSKRQLAPIKRLLEPVLDKGKSMTYDSYTLVNKNKKTFPYTISVTPLYERHTIIGADIFLRDIRKEKEREKQKDDFISMVSHELRTPITSIKAYNQLLLRQLTNEDNGKKQLVIKMESQLDRLSRLIHDFFELSRLQSGKLRLKRDYFRIDELVTSVIETIQIAYPTRHIALHGNTESIVFADRDRLEQVLINLITNAIKYSPSDKKIDLLLSDNKKYITLSVRDYGKGIAPEDQKKIFDLFYQIESASRSKGGLGIGLYLSHSIIKAHGGKIKVVSYKGKGSTFSFTLPVSK